MKKAVLSGIGADDLERLACQVGAFEPSDPAEWVVTPVKLTVQ